MKRIITISLILLLITIVTTSIAMAGSSNEVENKEDYNELLKIKAESMGLTIEELKENTEKEYEEFKAKAESMGLTVEELKAKIYEDYKSKAESMGLTIEELKEKMIVDKEKKDYNLDDFKEYIRGDISEKELNTAIELFNKAVEIEKKGEDAKEVWIALKAMDIYK